jgi:putative transposase
LLQRVYVLLVTEIQTRTARIPGVTGHPAGARTARQARNVLMDPGERASRFKFLLRDRDGKFTAASGEVSAGNGTRLIKTPVRSPRANSSAERSAGTLSRDCLDHLLIPAGSISGRCRLSTHGTTTATDPTRRCTTDLRCVNPARPST